MLMEWIYCPICGNKTRLKIREDTKLENFPLYCPKCKQESLIEVKQFQIKVSRNCESYVFLKILKTKHRYGTIFKI